MAETINCDCEKLFDSAEWKSATKQKRHAKLAVKATQDGGEPEVWASIPGYDGYYEASSLGRIRSIERLVRHNYGGMKKQRGKVLATSVLPGGYEIVALCKDGKPVNARVPRLVLMAFCGVPQDGMAACHGDGNPSNNRLSNLRWGTYKENESDKILHGTSFVGERATRAVLSEADALEIIGRPSDHRSSLAKEFGVSEATIRAIRTGRSWMHLSRCLPAAC